MQHAGLLFVLVVLYLLIFFFLFLNLLGQANQIEVTSEQWRNCFILSWDSFLLLYPFLSVHLREPKVLVRQQCCTVLPATRKLLDGCWAGKWMLIVAVWPAWFFWLGLTGPIVLPSKGSATIPPSLLSSSTVLLKHLLGRMGLPGGWGLHGSGSYLPVFGHSLTERTGASRRTWLCIPCPAKAAPGSLELSGCPLYSTKQPTAKCQESQAKTCALTSQEMLSYAELVVLLFTAKRVAFLNEMLVVTEKTEDEWCKISFPCSRFLIPSSPGSLGSLDSLPTPALLVVLAILCSTECFLEKLEGLYWPT